MNPYLAYIVAAQHLVPGAQRSGEQVRERLTVHLVVGVVGDRQRHSVLAPPLRTAQHLQQHLHQLRGHWNEPLTVGLGRHDVQQRHERRSG